MQKLFSNKFFSQKISHDDSSKKWITVLGSLSTIISLLCIILSLALPISIFYKIIIILPAISVPPLLTLLIKTYIFSSFKWMEKESLLKRLGQKKVNYLENIIQNSNDIILTIDFESLILKFNKGAEYHFGYSQEEVLGKPLDMLFVKNKEIANIVKKADNIGNVVNEDISMKSKSGEIKQLNLAISKKLCYG